MASNNTPNFGSLNNDGLDINELASLNEDITNDFIEQLQSKVSVDANTLSENAQLFEEVKPEEDKPKEKVNINTDIDDNFIKKYKARLDKQRLGTNKTDEDEINKPKSTVSEEPEEEVELNRKDRSVPTIRQSEESGETDTTTPGVVNEVAAASKLEGSTQNAESSQVDATPKSQEGEIYTITNGNITEKPLPKEFPIINNGLGIIDENSPYAKYIVYIEKENKEFFDSLTVQERKNLINKIIKEQGNIIITKQKYNRTQDFIRHAIIAILTIAIAIPVTYTVINTALEASINNYRRSQGMFQVLYKEHGKIKTNINLQ